MTSDAEMGAVLFDVDGTLVDTNYLHVVAWLGAFQAAGHQVDAAAIHRALGMGSSELIEHLVGPELAERVGDQVKSEHTSRYHDTRPLMRRFEGSADLLRAVAKRSVVVLATSASPEDLSAMLEVLDADDAISSITGAEDVDAAKPEPDLIQTALQRANVPASRAVFVGDSVWDVEAAGRADVPCVGVLSGGVSRAELSDAGAIAVYRDVAELLERLDESPLTAVF
ncbi:MAG: HAD family hydrolase [Actinomycetota bacterium]|nr:HAD family hydrolase [Actinomycetota bacterium]